MEVNHDIDRQVLQFCDWYGDGRDGSSPTNAQWRTILTLPPENPLKLVNFFKLSAEAEYAQSPSDAGAVISGMEAFNNYAAVSVPAMEKAGGSFLHVGPYGGMFLGDSEDWDIIAIGAFPNLDAFVALYADRDYRDCFKHRVAACERQKVMICAG